VIGRILKELPILEVQNCLEQLYVQRLQQTTDHLLRPIPIPQLKDHGIAKASE
jgi:hypothetical protein